MSKATRNWSLAMEDLRDLIGRNDELDPTDCASLGNHPTARLAEFSRQLERAHRRVQNCIWMWKREEARLCPDCGHKTRLTKERTLFCAKCGEEW